MYTLLARLLTIAAISSVMSCSTYTTIYPSSIQIKGKEIKSNLYIGSYWDGDATGRSYRSWNAAIDSREFEKYGLVAWWSLKTTAGYKYYYIRSRKGETLEMPIHPPWSDERIYHYFSFGPLLLEETAMNEEQKQTSVYHNAGYRGKKRYLWGKHSKFYYAAENKSIRTRETPSEWQSIDSIELTEEQYEFLDSRCSAPWKHVKCFVDDKFPKLTNEQYEYIKAREREGDDDRLNGEENPPLPPRGRWWL